ncbi:MAG: cyclic nucleotide-binding domain-containing protein [Myxococcota bacterium]
MTAPLNELTSHPFVKELTEEQLRRLFPCARVIRFAPGAYVFRENASADTLYLLRSGRVTLEQQIPGQGTVQLENLRTGDVLGLSWIFPGGRWVADARAVETTEAVAVDASCLHATMNADPGLGLALAKQLIYQLYHRLERARLQRLDVYREGA